MNFSDETFKYYGCVELPMEISKLTRISNETPSRGGRTIAINFRDKKVLDFGAGNGRNTRYLREMGFDVVPYDPYPSEKVEDMITDFDLIKDQEFDIVLCSFVLNVLPPLERDNVVEQLQQLNYKYIVVEVRAFNDIQRNRAKWKRHQDGYITNRGTFQKGYFPYELQELPLGEFKQHLFKKDAIGVIFKRD